MLLLYYVQGLKIVASTKTVNMYQGYIYVFLKLLIHSFLKYGSEESAAPLGIINCIFKCVYPDTVY